VLFQRLLRDPRVPRSSKALVALLVAYMVMPFDLILDVIPVIGQLDDIVFAGLVLRWIMRGAGQDAVRELWPGPPESLNAILALAFSGGRHGARDGPEHTWRIDLTR
jgi:uncharacterized membrane protein YkvA (DUF1232 family)